MRESSESPVAYVARQMRGTRIPRGEQSFPRNKLADVARVLWPQKTAANLAARANCSERAAKFYLAGTREWSAAAQAAIVSAMLE